MFKTTMAFGSAGLAIATTDDTALNLAAAIKYMIDGKTYDKAATDEVPLGIVGDNFVVPTGYICQYLIGINAAGAVSSYQGTFYKTEVVDGATKYRGYRVVKDAAGLPTRYEELSALHDYTSNFLPVVPDGICPIGAAIVAPTVAATFTAGTTQLDATNVNATFANFGVVPVASAI